MEDPSRALAAWIVDTTYSGQVVIMTLASGQRFAVKSAGMSDEAMEGVLFCEFVDGRELLVVITAIAAAEEQDA